MLLLLLQLIASTINWRLSWQKLWALNSTGGKSSDLWIVAKICDLSFVCKRKERKLTESQSPILGDGNYLWGLIINYHNAELWKKWNSHSMFIMDHHFDLYWVSLPRHICFIVWVEHGLNTMVAHYIQRRCNLYVIVILENQGV